MLGGVCSNQALGGEDWRWLAGRVVMHVGSPDRAVADVAREVARAVKKAAPDALPEVSREGGGAIRCCCDGCTHYKDAHAQAAQVGVLQ